MFWRSARVELTDFAPKTRVGETSMTVRTLATLLCLTLATGTASAATWQLVTTGKNWKGYVDVGSWQIDPAGVVKAWVRRDLTEPEATASGKVYFSFQDESLYNCQTRQITTITQVFYGKNGEAVHKTDAPFPPETVVPDTQGEDIWQYICTAAHRFGSAKP